MDKPTDEQILAALREGGRCMTYVVANKLRRNFWQLKTDFVLRRLKAMEKTGEVRRVETDYAVMFRWEIASKATATDGASE